MEYKEDNKKYSSRVRNEEAPKLYDLESDSRLRGIYYPFRGADEDSFDDVIL